MARKKGKKRSSKKNAKKVVKHNDIASPWIIGTIAVILVVLLIFTFTAPSVEPETPVGKAIAAQQRAVERVTIDDQSLRRDVAINKLIQASQIISESDMSLDTKRVVVAELEDVRAMWERTQIPINKE